MKALAKWVCVGGEKQGFQHPIATDSFIVDGVGAFGTVQSERKLTYVELSITGHL